MPTGLIRREDNNIINIDCVGGNHQRHPRQHMGSSGDEEDKKKRKRKVAGEREGSSPAFSASVGIFGTLTPTVRNLFASAENSCGVTWAARVMGVSRRTAIMRFAMYACVFIVSLSVFGSRRSRSFGRSMAYAAEPMMMERYEAEPMVASAMYAEDAVAMDEGAPMMRSASVKMKRRSAPMGASFAQSAQKRAVDTNAEPDLNVHGKMLVKTGNIALSVTKEHYAHSSSTIEKTMRRVGGDTSYVGSQSVGRHNVQMTIWVPVQKFDAVMEALEGLVGENGDLGSDGDVHDSSKHARDVTAEYVDRSARKSALEGTHKQLLKLMEKAQNVNEVLQVQRELNRINQDIEAQAARMKHLKSTSDMSQITVRVSQKHVYEPPKPAPWWSTFAPGRAFHHAIDALRDILAGILDVLVWSVVFCIPVSIAGCGVLKLANWGVSKATAAKTPGAVAMNKL